MRVVTTDRFRTQLAAGSISLSGDTFNVALLSGSYIGTASLANLKANNEWSSLSAYETVGTGYTAGGQELSGLSITEGNPVTSPISTTVWDADNSSWSNTTLSATGAAIYKPSADIVCIIIDFQETKSTESGPFTISWNTNGVANII